ncbi:MAG: hypothetical protein U0894_15390 [Pirellulales bacterium]
MSGKVTGKVTGYSPGGNLITSITTAGGAQQRPRGPIDGDFDVTNTKP